jgi:2-phosphosulfolactate phosphatase
LQESTFRYRTEYVIVVVDVIRATTTAVTALSTGRRVFPARTSDEAFVVASTLSNPILAGELGGNMPYGFDMTNSPAGIAERNDVERPMVLVSSSGTELIMNSAGSKGVYIACFRNFSAVAEWLATQQYDRIAVLGAGTRGQFRREDQMCCGWIAGKLVDAGYEAETPQTREYVYRWKSASPQEAEKSESADYLRNSGQVHDLDFVLKHVDDLDIVPKLVNYELKTINK